MDGGRRLSYLVRNDCKGRKGTRMSEKEVAAILPTLDFGDEEDTTVLARPSVETVVDGEALSGSAEVRLDLVPRPAVYLYCMFEITGLNESVRKILSRPDVVSYLDVNGQRLEGFGVKSDVVPEEQDELEVKWCPKFDPIPELGDKTTQMRKMLLHLFNFNFRGWTGSVQHDGTTRHGIEHIDLESEIWNVKMRSLTSTRKNQKLLQEKGGYRLTHVVEVSKAEECCFSGEEADSTLEALGLFLCFVKGTQCDPVCPSGVDASGKRVWSKWSSPREWEPKPLSWSDRGDPRPLVDFFPGFMKRWAIDNWREALRDVIWWYASANNSSRGIDAGIILAQTAIERLSYEYCVREKVFFLRQGFNALPAADQYRVLFSSLGIPREIPPCATSLVSAGKGRNWVDGPQALTAMRNDLVHGGLKRAHFSDECYVEAWRLTLWFLEMAVLALCGFRGPHWNRNNSQVEVVPWQSAGEQTSKGTVY